MRYYFISYTGTVTEGFCHGSCSFTSEGGHVTQEGIFDYLKNQGVKSPVINNIIEMTEQDWKDFFGKN